MSGSPRLISVARALIGWSARLLAVTSAVWLATISIAFAESLQSSPLIFDVRRSLPLEPTEPVFHDFYINAGAEAGFRKGLYVTVVRLVPVHDPIQNKQQGELPVNVARLQVIQVSPAITVARLVAEFADDERPTLEYEAVMIGDRIDLSSLTSEAPKKKGKSTTHARRVFDETALSIAEEAKANEVHVAQINFAPPEPVRTPTADTAVKMSADSAEKPAAQAPVPIGSPEAQKAAAPSAKTASPSAAQPVMVPVPAPAASH